MTLRICLGLELEKGDVGSLHSSRRLFSLASSHLHIQNMAKQVMEKFQTNLSTILRKIMSVRRAKPLDYSVT